ncbi:MAG: GDSL-type esterase/lipase family protein [Anaerolineae bacterium]|nr:GDSL-type esterase/lipase family protein [Anaerolineae bacterium]
MVGIHRFLRFIFIGLISFLLLAVGVERRLIPSPVRSSPALEGQEIRRGAIVSISMALCGEGNPWVVWEEAGSGREVSDSEIYFASWNGHSWSAPQVLVAHPDLWDHAPVIACDNQGKAWVVWSGSTGTDDRLFYAKWEGDGWSRPQVVRTTISIRNHSPALAAGEDGTLWPVWVGFDGNDEEIFFSRWVGDSWEPERRLNGDDQDSELYDLSPSIAFDGQGNPWVVWVGYEGWLDEEIFFARWGEDGWSQEGRVSSDDATPDLMPTLAVDKNGLPWVAWAGKYRGEYEILYSHWDGHGWSEEELVETTSFLKGGEPILFSDPAGRLKIVWKAYDLQGSYIAYSRWTDMGWSAPEQISGPEEILPAFPEAMVDDRGDGWVIWAETAPGHEALHWRRVEGALPRLPEGIAGRYGIEAMVALVNNRYAAFGDSITWGGYVSDPYQPYPINLEGYLDNNVAPSEVINAGLDGEWTSQGRDRVLQVMDAYQPQFVLIMEGTNDVTHWKDSTYGGIIDNLDVMVQRVMGYGGKPVLATLPPRKDDREDETEYVNGGIRGIANRRRVPLADVWQAIENYPNWWNYYNPDRIHPNGPLMEVIAQAFYDSMVDWPYIYEDDDPPSSQVNDLAVCQTTSNFPVSWWGEDGDGTGILSYDIQYKDGDGGWTGWLMDTTSSWATFTGGQRGHTYYFRSRAKDRRGNVEGWPTSPDYDTSTLVAYSLSGEVKNNRGLPVAVAKVSASPYGCSDAYTGHLGKYTLPLMVTGNVTITVSQNNFGNLPPMYGVEAIESETTGVDFWLPPSDDVVANGQFEEGLSDWLYLEAVEAVTDTVHTGLKAVELGGDSAISQTVTITPTTIYSPTLSFMYIYTPGDPGDYLEVRLNDTRVGDPLVPALDWAHAYLDLSAHLGQTVDLSFVLHQGGATPAYAYLDEISLGSAGQAPEVVFLPLIRKEY